MKSKIQWTDYTWNFISGCTQISPACENCYAKAMTKRLQGIAKAKTAKLRCQHCGFDLKNNFKVEDYDLVWGGKVLCPNQHEAFEMPMYWFGWDKVLFHDFQVDKILDKKKYKSGSKIFVCSMSDLFHEDIYFNDIFHTFNLMEEREDLTFQVLTKRADRILGYFRDFLQSIIPDNDFNDSLYEYEDIQKHIWLGVTAENQEMADKRIPLLLECKEITKCKAFVSVEPMLESVNLVKYLYAKDHPPKLGDSATSLDWVIVGGESGNRAREMREDWVMDLYQQCKDYGIPFFFKQKGNNFNFSNPESARFFLDNIIDTKEFPK